MKNRKEEKKKGRKNRIMDGKNGKIVLEKCKEGSEAGGRGKAMEKAEK